MMSARGSRRESSSMLAAFFVFYSLAFGKKNFDGQTPICVCGKMLLWSLGSLRELFSNYSECSFIVVVVVCLFVLLMAES